MDRDREAQERSGRLTDYIADEDVPGEEKGLVMLALLVNALLYLLLTSSVVTWVIATAVRVWRRREAGMTAAVKRGVHKPTLAALVTATLAYEICRRLGVAALDRRAGAWPTNRT